jgi:aminoglycoside phosphotransferase (APT) family kinase protein
MPEVLTDLTVWTERAVDRLTGWDDTEVASLRAVVAAAQDVLDDRTRSCLVHSDLNPKNLLVDPDSLQVTGLLDWEFAHAGSPYADLGNLLRFDREPAFARAVLAAREAFVPDPRPDALDRARADDLFALVDLATRRAENPVAARADALLHAIAATGDLHTLPPG